MQILRLQYKKIEDKTMTKLKQVFPNTLVQGRTKELFSIVGKVRKRNKEKPGFTYFDLTDIGGFRVTFLNNKELLESVQKLKNSMEIVEEEDYVSNPKAGYRSFHFLAKIDGKVIEIQFRTSNQTKWADWVHNKFYKNTEDTKRRIGEDNFNIAYRYARDMADYYAKIDNSEHAERQLSPEIIKEIGDVE